MNVDDFFLFIYLSEKNMHAGRSTVINPHVCGEDAKYIPHHYAVWCAKITNTSNMKSFELCGHQLCGVTYAVPSMQLWEGYMKRITLCQTHHTCNVKHIIIRESNYSHMWEIIIPVDDIHMYRKSTVYGVLVFNRRLCINMAWIGL